MMDIMVMVWTSQDLLKRFQESGPELTAFLVPNGREGYDVNIQVPLRAIKFHRIRDRVTVMKEALSQ